MDKMREEFEAWCASIGFTLKPNAFDNGDYAMGYGWEEWNAWQASRAALCVELPSKINDDNDLFSYGFDSAISSAEVSLENVGVSYK